MSFEITYEQIIAQIQAGKTIPRLEHIKFDATHAEESFNKLILQNSKNQNLLQEKMRETATEMNEILSQFKGVDENDEELMTKIRTKVKPPFDKLQKELDILLGIYRIILFS